MPKSGEAMTPPALCSYLPPCAWLTLEFDLLFHQMTKLNVFFLAYSDEDTSDKDDTEEENAYHRDCNG